MKYKAYDGVGDGEKNRSFFLATNLHNIPNYTNNNEKIFRLNINYFQNNNSL